LLFWQVEPPEQTRPHEPQFALSVARFAQAPPEHCIWPAPHEVEQTLLLHTWVPEQVVVQLPQWLLSEPTH